MANLVLEGKMDTTLDIDVCAACRVIWFDRFEDLRLAPASTLKLFGVIGESSEAAAAPSRVFSAARGVGRSCS
jgi:Zn-finger nucleic acid-binding protein